MYDANPGGVQLEGRAVQRPLPPAQSSELVTLLSKLLHDDGDRVHQWGWCQAPLQMLRALHEAGHVRILVYRQARLLNRDVTSSQIDLSQPKTDNTWALVHYVDHVDDSTYLCVMQVQYYAKVSIGSPVMVGFDPTECAKYGVGPPTGDGGRLIRHRPLRVAVGKMWLAAGVPSSRGAVGCRHLYNPASGTPPDLVAVKNMSDQPPFAKGSQREILDSPIRSRCYGTYIAHVDHLCCQLGPTAPQPGDGCRCFLTSSKRSGKK